LALFLDIPPRPEPISTIIDYTPFIILGVVVVAIIVIVLVIIMRRKKK
jgi:hypothetical protein